MAAFQQTFGNGRSTIGVNPVMNQRVIGEDGVVVDDRHAPTGGLLRAIVSIAAVLVVVAVVAVLVIKETSSSSAKQARQDHHLPRRLQWEAQGIRKDPEPQLEDQHLRDSAQVHGCSGDTVSEGVAPVRSVDSKQTAAWELTGDRSINGSAAVRIDWREPLRTCPGQ